jgi:hypothetical protein
MRITKGLLHKFAQETVKQRKRDEPDLYAAYLTGSLLRDEPLLGGSTDIDLVLVHKYTAPIPRETEKVTREISFDIFHTVKTDYDEYRQLRQDPWLGYPLTHYNIMLFDTDHWLEFIQATVNAEFHNVENVLARANTLLSGARNKWFTLFQAPPENHLEWLDCYLKVVESAVNAILGLISPPLTNRRFMLDLQSRAEELGANKIFYGVKGLLGLSEDTNRDYNAWIISFEQALDHLHQSDSIPVHLAPCRRSYYVDALHALTDSGEPDQASWLLLRTWVDAQLALGNENQPATELNACLAALNLDESAVGEKTAALDTYLDNAEIILESWEETYVG